jgi:hypothetical protein
MNPHILLAKRQHYETSHLLHLVLSIFTAGIWVPVWVLVSLSNANERRRIDRQLSAL